MNINDYINSEIEIKDVLDKYLNKGERLTIFDIGACEGEDSIRYSKHFQNSQVFAFEPHPLNAQKIINNIKKYDRTNITIVNKALSNIIGKSSFYVSSGKPENVAEDEEWDYGNKSSSLLKPDLVSKTHPWLKFDEQIEVETETIENFCFHNEIKKIDFIHLDVQGAELMVLKGAGQFLQNVKVIWMEVEKIKLYDKQPLKKDLEKFMKIRGFKKVYENLNNISGDQLYVNRNHLPDFTIKDRVKGFMTTLSLSKPVLKKNHKKISYSQSGEDLIISFVFNAIGIQRPSFLDIGAHHPYYLNNTAIFYANGSRGINIEPDSYLFKELNKKRPKDINLNIGIGDRENVLDFYIMSSPTLNTFSKEEAFKIQEEGLYHIKEVAKVKLDTITNIINKYNNREFPDLLSLDVEGLDFEILYSIDFRKNFPKVICIETITFSETGHGKKQHEIIHFLENNGYLLYADTYINSIFVRKDLWHR